MFRRGGYRFVDKTMHDPAIPELIRSDLTGLQRLRSILPAEFFG
jgi:hypothetical protein